MVDGRLPSLSSLDGFDLRAFEFVWLMALDVLLDRVDLVELVAFRVKDRSLNE